MDITSGEGAAPTPGAAVWNNKVLTPLAVVRNTFVDVVEVLREDEGRDLPRRSASVGNLSRSTGSSQEQCLGYWLPSLTSSTTSSSNAAGGKNQEAPSSAPRRGSQVDTTSTNTMTTSAGHWQLVIPSRASSGMTETKQQLPSDTFRNSSQDLILPARSIACSSFAASPPQALHADACNIALVERVHSEIFGAVPIEKIEELANRGLLTEVPRRSTGELTSMGSIRHSHGDCKPCSHWVKDRCQHSICCHYCHFMHEGQKPKRFRPSKQARERNHRKAQARAERIDGSRNAGLEQLDDTGAPREDSLPLGCLSL